VPQWVFELAVLARTAVLVWSVVAWFREPSRVLTHDIQPRTIPAIGHA